MSYSYDIRLFDGVSYMKVVDHQGIISDWKKAIVALRAERDDLATDKAEYKEAAKIFSRRLTECEQESHVCSPVDYDIHRCCQSHPKRQGRQRSPQHPARGRQTSPRLPKVIILTSTRRQHRTLSPLAEIN